MLWPAILIDALEYDKTIFLNFDEEVQVQDYILNFSVLSSAPSLHDYYGVLEQAVGSPQPVHTPQLAQVGSWPRTHTRQARWALCSFLVDVSRAAITGRPILIVLSSMNANVV